MGEDKLKTDQKAKNVLFLSRHNSARSLMAECLLNSIGSGRYHAFSAGVIPATNANPFAIDLLSKNKLPTDRLRCKDWQRFSAPGLLELDFVISVCEFPSQEINATWPGSPLVAHWFQADPAASDGTDEEKRRAYFHIYSQLFRRLTIFTSLPLDKLDRETLNRRLDDIGAGES